MIFKSHLDAFKLKSYCAPSVDVDIFQDIGYVDRLIRSTSLVMADQNTSANTPKPKPGSAKKPGSSGKRKKKKSGSSPELQTQTQEGRRLRSSGNKLMSRLMEGLTLEELEGQPKGVGLIYDEKMLETASIFDPDFPERPERISLPFKRCQEYGLVDRCTQIPARSATEEEILLVHDSSYLDQVRQTQGMSHGDLEALSHSMDGVHFHQKTYESALMAAGSSIEIVEQVVKGKVRHGYALVRPPGHHAMLTEACGYCFFNNAAIAARYALDQLNVDRILIVDWDLHHGQGTQYAFYDDPRVLYFSIHRYEHGAFWPNLRESDYDYVGKGKGRGFNINVPLNKIGSKDGDYLAILQQILMPVAYEFSPQLVIVSCGYDAAIGDPEGCSEVTPAAYAQFIHMLIPLAHGKLAVLHEGGYCLKSLSESTALVLRSMLGDPCPPFPSLPPPLPETIATILHVVRVMMPYWKCFYFNKLATCEEDLPDMFQNIEIPKKGVTFFNEETRPAMFEIVGENAYEYHTADVAAAWDVKIDALIASTRLTHTPNRTCLVYDERMRKHKCISDKSHVERPDRITRIYDKHADCGLVDRCKRIQARCATEDEILSLHGEKYVRKLRELQYKSPDELCQLERALNSVYLTVDSYECAALALGGTLNVVDEVVSGGSRNGVAIVRPPGHHAEVHAAMGFCFFNMVAIAAKHAQRKHGIKRVLILDWDVHHGNGTQHMFEKDPSVLYISLHRRDDGWFFPMGPDNDYDQVGLEEGEGFNVNIPWNVTKKKMGDAEYIAAFQQVVMPIAHEFAPHLVLVSAGFDAARGDPLGGCMVSPEGYAHMTHMLSSLAEGRVIMVLEGGYNLNSISESMAACTSVLLGDACPPLPPLRVNDSGARTIRDVLLTQQKYWSSLRGYRVTMPARRDTLVWLGHAKPNDMASVTTEGTTYGDVTTPSRDSDSVSSDSKWSPLAAPLDTSSEIFREDDSLEKLTQKMENINVNEETSSSEYQESSASDLSSPSEKVTEGACGGTSNGSTLVQVLGKAIVGQDDVQMYAVVPLTTCPHLEGVREVPPSGLDVDQPCLECGHVGENWVCLTCYEVHCGRFVEEHMVCHGATSGHCMVLSYADLSAWCYACDHYVHNPVIIPAKQAAHRSKFNEEMKGN